MFDPSVGRWLQMDPLLFSAGDANLYRYVGNSPTNATDPAGLEGQKSPAHPDWTMVGGNPVNLGKKNTFSVGEGDNLIKGTVAVFTDATVAPKGKEQVELQKRKGEIWIQATLERGDPQKLSFIQFLSRVKLGKDGNPLEAQGTYAVNIPESEANQKDKKVYRVYGRGLTHVDAAYSNNAFYPTNRRILKTVAVMNGPTAMPSGATREVDCTYDMFIVADGRVVYRVHWLMIFKAGEQPKYVVDTTLTGPTNTFGNDAWKKDKLLVGYQKRGDNGQVSEPLEIKNPINKENR